MERGSLPGWGKFSLIHWGQIFWARRPNVAPPHPTAIIKAYLYTYSRCSWLRTALSVFGTPIGGQKIFSSPYPPRPALGLDQIPLKWAPGHGVEDSTPSSAKVKNENSYTSVPLLCFLWRVIRRPSSLT